MDVAMGRKFLIIVGDGMADYPLPELGNRTPLQVAHMPNMDAIVPKSKLGLIRTIPEGLDKGSDTASLSILGYDPRRSKVGRGALEAAARGIPIGEGDIAFRCNIITEEEGILQDYSADHISSEEARGLIDALKKEFVGGGADLYAGLSYRNLLVLRDSGRRTFSTNIVTCPPHDVVGRPIPDVLPKASKEDGEDTAEYLRKLISKSKEALERHPINKTRTSRGGKPANMIWPWGQGGKPQMQKFQAKYGLRAAVISAVDLIKGIGFYAGMDVVEVPGATGFYDTNYENKADYALRALEDHDFVLLHVEAPDEASHAGDVKLKIKTVEDFDRRLVGRVLRQIGGIVQNYRIAILPDHFTPIKVKTHTDDPVPFLIFDPHTKGDGVARFCEASAKEGSLGLIEGCKLTEIMFKDRVGKA